MMHAVAAVHQWMLTMLLLLITLIQPQYQQVFLLGVLISVIQYTHTVLDIDCAQLYVKAKTELILSMIFRVEYYLHLLYVLVGKEHIAPTV